MVTVRIKSILGQDTVIEGVELSATVSHFKDLVQEKTSIPKENQRIIFSGRVLKDEDTLETSGISDGVQVHLVSINRGQASAAAARPGSNPAAAGTAPPRSLFADAPAARAGPGMGGMPGGMNPQQLGQLLQSPQGQQLLAQLMQNPEALAQMLPPQMLNDPEVQELMRNPQAFAQMLAQLGAAEMMGGGGVLVPRDVFDVAMDVMNGAAIPPEYQVHGARAAAGGSARQDTAGPHQEVISRAQINDALDAVVGLLPGGPAAAPAQSSGSGGSADTAGAAADVDGDDAMSDAATAGSTAGETQDNMDTAGAADEAVSGASDELAAGSGGGMDVDAPPPAGGQRYEAQLEMLRAMGFTDDAACVAALDAAGGDVQTAITFLAGN
eukprot:m.499606 g.499606  ORF g.499606 m.499606 type:complete len:383 (+) comp21826_c0_seq3:85-1233(+)